jgi:glycosyltransferase involved in cell wall biosynthesis
VKVELDAKKVECSVVITSLCGESSLKKCLDSVLVDKNEESEIIVADCCLKNRTTEFIEKYPKVTFIKFTEKATLPNLLSAGIGEAKGEIIAITDSSCVVADNWISSILEAHQTEGSPVIGGAVEMNEDSRNLMDWSAYFCDYGQFMSPAPKGIVKVVPGNNLSIKRWALAKGREYVENEFWKTLWCRVLQSEGIKLFSEPSISVEWQKNYRLIPFLVMRFHQGRCFAAMRVENKPAAKRILFAAGSVFLPFLLLFRTVKLALQKKRFLGRLVLSLPLIVSADTFRSVGETIGYVAGTGISCERTD